MIIRLIILLITVILVRVMLIKALSEKPLPNQVRLPKIAWQVGIATVLVFLVFVILSIYMQEHWIVVAGFTAFECFGLYLALYGLVWKIEYDDTSFTYRTMFGKTIVKSYSNITNIKRGKYMVRFYSGKQCFYLDKNATGAPDFIRILANKTRT